MLPAHIPSPSRNLVHVGPFPIRFYALCIIAGVIAAAIIGDRRFVARGGRKGAIADVATWAVPFGLVGARIYHLATNPELYWGKNGQGTVAALKIWDGGLGIWGAVVFGALGAWLACRHYKLSFAMVADSLAPALPVAQALGRWGNWFNQELYGRPTDLPWALRIDPAHRPAGLEQVATYHPTFLYEALWNLALIAVLLRLERRWPARPGRLFALYVGGYALGRLWVESLRIDHANTFFGLRLNVWVSVVVLVLVAGFFVRDRMRISSP